METKKDHTKRLLPERTHPIIELFFEFAQLKNLYRQGWLKRGVSKLDCETVAEHSFGVAILGYMIAEEYRPDLNSCSVMRLGLFHEVGEIYAGDITPIDGIDLEEKAAKEYESVQKVFSTMPNAQKYISIWKEYEEQKTPEAKFTAQIDKLEMALQAHLYERMNHTGLDEFFPDVQQRLASPDLKLIFDDLLRLR